MAVARPTGDAFPLITKRVQGWVDQGYYSGCSVWIAQDDHVLYQRSFGDHAAGHAGLHRLGR